MLAPRRTLWSTPDPVVRTIVSSWMTTDYLSSNDVICDIGCGDGRVLIEWATAVSLRSTETSSSSSDRCMTFVGLEVCPERAEQAQANVKKAYKSGLIASHVKVTIYCANALEETHLYQQATIIFLYLIPRGLRLLHPILKTIAKERRRESDNDGDDDEPLKVVTYMSPLPNETPVAKQQCRVDHQPGAEWPLYLYYLYPDDDDHKKDDHADK